MVVYCGLHAVTTPTIVTSIGTGANDGWQIVARLPSSELPNLPGQYVIHVQGKFGALQWSGTQPITGLAQIRLGSDSGTIHPDYQAQVAIVQPINGAAGQPFGFLVMVNSQVSDSLWGSSWSGSSDLCVWARLFTNGDPLQYAAQFTVADVTFLWWDVGEIPLNKRRSFTANLGGASVALGPAWTTHTAPIAIGSPGELWLHFYELQWLPVTDGGGDANELQFGFYESGSPANWTTKIGFQRLGCLTRGPIAAVQTARQAWSGFFAATNPSSTVQPALRTRALNTSALYSRLHRLRLFSVRVDDLPQFAIAQQASWGDLLTYNGNEAVPYPLEPTITQNLQPMVLYCCTQNTASASVWMQHGWHLRTNDGRVLWDSHLRNQVRTVREGLQDFAASRHGMIPRTPAVRYEGFQWTDPAFPLQVGGHGRDVVAVQFLPDTEPDLLPPVVPGAGAPIVIVPDREALDVSALPDLPIQPDGAVTQTPMDPEPERLVGVSGVVRTWPMFTRARWQLGLVWSRVTRAQADTLLTFLRENPTFRYQRPRGVAAEACAVIEQPSVTGHVVFSVSVQVATLIHTAPP